MINPFHNPPRARERLSQIERQLGDTERQLKYCRKHNLGELEKLFSKRLKRLEAEFKEVYRFAADDYKGVFEQC